MQGQYPGSKNQFLGYKNQRERFLVAYVFIGLVVLLATLLQVLSALRNSEADIFGISDQISSQPLEINVEGN
jgi:hypothetical protein